MTTTPDKPKTDKKDPRVEGCWLAYDFGFNRVVVFFSGVAALRYAVEYGLYIQWVAYGADLRAAVADLPTRPTTSHMNFNRGNAIKYIWRAGSKGDEIEDLRKAAWYVGREIERLMSGLQEVAPATTRVGGCSICAACDDSIIWIPGNGWGQQGEWRHLAPPKAGITPHEPTPKVFVT